VIVYGRNPVREALRGRRASAVGKIWATTRAAREPWLGERAPKPAEPSELAALCGSDAHQGVCAEVGPYPYAGPEEILAGTDPLVLALDQIQDPQNLGALCRTAECAGVSGVALPERRAAEITPAACRASAGAVEHLRVARVRNLADFLVGAKEAGCWCYGASAGAAEAYDAADYRGGVVLVLGGEGKGLRPRVAAVCDQLVGLPLRGRIASLNVSAAGAVLLYEILQRRSDLDSVP
jgi:23S rRNA (guanosine2251-2'-O)-methyltransferase